MKIPLCKPSISSNEINLVSRTLKSNWLTHGPYNYKFEELFNRNTNMPEELPSSMLKYAWILNTCGFTREDIVKRRKLCASKRI